MSVNKEYQIVNLMRVTLSIIFFLVVLFMMLKFLWDSESDSVTKFSAFFTAISSLGILATIGVYFWQKKDSNKLNIKIQKSIYNVLMDVISSTTKNINNIIEIKKILDTDLAKCEDGRWVIFKLESMIIFLSRHHKKRWIIRNRINSPLDSILTKSMGISDGIISDILLISNLNRDVESYSESAFQMHIPEDSDGLTKLVMRNKLIIDCAKMDNYFSKADRFDNQIELLEKIKNKCEIEFYYIK